MAQVRIPKARAVAMIVVATGVGLIGLRLVGNAFPRLREMRVIGAAFQ